MAKPPINAPPNNSAIRPSNARFASTATTRSWTLDWPATPSAPGWNGQNVSLAASIMASATPKSWKKGSTIL